MEYKIIDVEEACLEQIALIEQECFSCPWTVEQLRTQLKDKNHEFIAAVSGDKVLGYVGMMYVLDEGYISNVAVTPECRKKGIADALIDRLIEISSSLGLSFVSLEVRESNAPALALYSKHGFSPVGRRKNYYVLPKEDAILMTTFLNRGADT